MKKLIKPILLSGVLIFLIFSCKNKTVEPDPFEVKSDEFIKAEIDGQTFDFRTVQKIDYQEAFKFGQAPVRRECAGCKNYMSVFFGQKDPSSTTPYSWFTSIEKVNPNPLIDDNTPIYYVSFRYGEIIDEQNSRLIYTARTSKLKDSWSEPDGEMTAKVISNQAGIVSGTFSGKTLDGKEIKNGSFSLRYKL